VNMMNKRQFWRMFKSFFPSGVWFVRLKFKTNPYLPIGTIVDIETTGLNPESDRILTLGIYRENKIFIYQLVKPRYRIFERMCRAIVRRLPKPLYAYAASFEQEFLQIPNGWRDLTRYYEVEYDEWCPIRRFRLVDVTTYPYETTKDFDINGAEVPQKWREWLKHRNLRILAEIPYHCMVDLRREVQLLTSGFVRNIVEQSEYRR